MIVLFRKRNLWSLRRRRGTLPSKLGTWTRPTSCTARRCWSTPATGAPTPSCTSTAPRWPPSRRRPPSVSRTATAPSTSTPATPRRCSGGPSATWRASSSRRRSGTTRRFSSQTKATWSIGECLDVDENAHIIRIIINLIWFKAIITRSKTWTKEIKTQRFLQDSWSWEDS